jgi:hypothetical protein
LVNLEHGALEALRKLTIFGRSKERAGGFRFFLVFNQPYERLGMSGSRRKAEE